VKQYNPTYQDAKTSFCAAIKFKVVRISKSVSIHNSGYYEGTNNRLARAGEMPYIEYMEDFYSKYPSRVGAGTGRSRSGFLLKHGYYATQRPTADIAQDAAMILNDGAIAVFKGEPPQTREVQSTIGPVYELGPGGSLAVPTGLVFIRFRDGIDAGSQQQEIEQSGFEVKDTVPYAPNAAWLKARSGSIADSLAGISKLAALPDVESVEPQMLMKGSSRS
jgi:hypothetical protein